MKKTLPEDLPAYEWADEYSRDEATAAAAQFAPMIGDLEYVSSMVSHNGNLFVAVGRRVFMLQDGKLVALEFVLTPPTTTKDTEP